MPQRLSSEWREHLGESWQDVHREFLHTIGNLTIVTQDWNTRKLSNKPLSEKSKALKNHGIHLNSRYFCDTVAAWDADAISKRANFLADLIVKVWPAFYQAARAKGIKGTSPLTMTIRGERFVVYSWRGMLLQMVDRLHKLQLLTDLDDAKREFGVMIERDKPDSPQYYKQSSAGWWIYVNHSAENVVHLCGRLARFCGLRDDEWSFTNE